MTVSLTTLEIINWNFKISWRRLTNSRCLLERGIEIPDYLSLSSFRLRSRGLNKLCEIACGYREINKDGCCGVADHEDNYCGVDIRCEVDVYRGIDGLRYR